jgi:hypothetical protein
MCGSNCSSSAQVESDRLQAHELAAALDEERSIQAEDRLQSILDDPAVVAACERPTDALDVSITYLHRVHFVSFYDAYRYRDEAHMLLQSSRIFYRSVPYYVSGSANIVPEVTKGESVFGEEGNKRKRSSSEAAVVDEDEGKVGDKIKPDDESKLVEVADEGEIADSGSKTVDGGSGTHQYGVGIPSLPAVAASTGIFVVNPKINDLIRASKVVVEARSRATETQVATAQLFPSLDEEVMTINNHLNETLMKEIEQHALKEEGRVRCWFPNCSKLFKGAEFLCKHITSKHGIQDLILHVCEPAMRKRYEDDKLLDRPLPMLAVEVVSGGVEFKFAKEIIEKHSKRKSDVGFQRSAPRFSGGRGPYRHDNRAEWRDKPRRSWAAPSDDAVHLYPRLSDVQRPPPPTAPPLQSNFPVQSGAWTGGMNNLSSPPPPPPPMPVPTRPIRSYMDVDAPKVSSMCAVCCVLYGYPQLSQNALLSAVFISC